MGDNRDIVVDVEDVDTIKSLAEKTQIFHLSVITQR